MYYYGALQQGKEIVIVGDKNENSAVFWMNNGKIMTWTRELGSFERNTEELKPGQFQEHCEKMVAEGHKVFVCGSTD